MSDRWGNLLSLVPVLTPDQSALHRMRVLRIMNDTRTKLKQKPLMLWNYVIATEIANGSSFMSSADGQLYVFLGLLNQVYTMPDRGAGSYVAAYLEATYGISSADQIGTAVYVHMYNYVKANAPRMELRRFVAYNQVDHVCYISNYRGQMWRLDGGEPRLLNNGEEGIFFIDDDGGQAYDPVIAPNDVLFDKVLSLNYTDGLGGMTPEQMKRVMTIWLLMLAFPDRLPTKPLLIIEGSAGSGKSSAISLIQFALLGTTKPMILDKNNPGDFGVTLLRSPIAMFDNVDSYIEWVPDAICAYATLGFWSKRKLYSNSDEVQVRPHAFIAVSTRNPASFRREDTADRSLVLRLGRRTTFDRFEKLQADVLAQRNLLIGEWMHHVNGLIAILRSDTSFERPETSRMADFSTFARVVGLYLGWDSGAVDTKDRNEVDELMKALADERNAFVNEEDPLVELLKLWLETNRRNVGCLISLQNLFVELDSRAQVKKIPFYKTSRLLATNLRSPHVERAYKVEMTAVDGHKHYRIWRVGDTQLRSVPPDDDDGNPGDGNFVIG